MGKGVGGVLFLDIVVDRIEGTQITRYASVPEGLRITDIASFLIILSYLASLLTNDQVIYKRCQAYYRYSQFENDGTPTQYRIHKMFSEIRSH